MESVGGRDSGGLASLFVLIRINMSLQHFFCVM
jgi:hypothetical protein